MCIMNNVLKACDYVSLVLLVVISVSCFVNCICML